MFSKLLKRVAVCAASLFVAGQSAYAATYTMSNTIGAGTATGFIETDGTLGVITDSNILSISINNVNYFG